MFKPLFEREISIRTIARRRQFAEARLRRDNERSMRVRPGISRKTKKRHEIRGVSRSIDLRPSAETNEFGHPLMEVIKLIAIRGVIVRGAPPPPVTRSGPRALDCARRFSAAHGFPPLAEYLCRARCGARSFCSGAMPRGFNDSRARYSLVGRREPEPRESGTESEGERQNQRTPFPEP